MSLAEFREASRAHLDRLGGLIERGSVPRLRKLYERSIADLQSKLAASIRGGAAPFTVQQHQVLLAQARAGMARISAGLGTTLGQQTAKVQEASALALIRDIKKIERKARGADVQLPIEQAAKFAGVVDRRRTSLLRLNKASMAKYGTGVVSKMEQAMGQSLLTGETGYKAIDRITDVMDMEWWRAERIVRTETAWAYNATQMDATAEAARSMPDLMMRWTEMVADVTLTKLDSRVGDDSCAMHGQLARPGSLFYMPDDYPANLTISPSLVGKAWTQPPNRPNDRAVLQPWRPGWGWGWVLVDGVRAPAPTKAPNPRRAEAVVETASATEAAASTSLKSARKDRRGAVAAKTVRRTPSTAEKELALAEGLGTTAPEASPGIAPLVPTTTDRLPGEEVGAPESPDWSFSSRIGEGVEDVPDVEQAADALEILEKRRRDYYAVNPDAIRPMPEPSPEPAPKKPKLEGFDGNYRTASDRSVVSYAPKVRKETWAEEDARKAEARQESERRARERWEKNRPIIVPPGYHVVEEFPGVKTYVSDRTGIRYTEMDVRRGQLDQPVPESDFARARIRSKGFFSKVKSVLHGIVRFGR